MVALVSSGDAGVYGMAGLAFELAKEDSVRVPIEVVPGVTAASAAAARLGAPLMLDFASISLSDLLVPWETIKKRVEAVAGADLTCALYNPRSKKRVNQLDEAAEIFRRYRENPARRWESARASVTTDKKKSSSRIYATSLKKTSE